MKPSKKNTAKRKKAGPARSLSVAGGSALSYDVFLGNNDYDTTGMTPAETLADISFELETATSAVLVLRHGISKPDALKLIDGLRWLVEQSDLPNTPDEPTRRKNNG